MESNTFNINDWLEPEKEVIPPPKAEQQRPPENTTEQEVELLVQAIEKSRTDLTVDYNNWIKIGFALATEFGEMGRSYFHRISKMYSQYKIDITDKQYDNCIKSNSNAIKINTLFYLATQAGIELIKEKKNSFETVIPAGEEKLVEEKEEKDTQFKTPLFPLSVYENLPQLIKEACELFPIGIERDIFLISALTVISGCLPNIEGIYFNRQLSAHLYLFITGPSASGKGTMMWSRYFAQVIHEEMYKNAAIDKEIYMKELEAYENLPKKEKVNSIKPVEPPRRMFFIPANSSSSALTQLLSENHFRGIIFESEADTLSNTAKQDWGDSSDIFRKAFHHENTSMARRTNNETIEITNPHLAICISGTPKQVLKLMPEVENGLFSRFMYYAFQDTRGFLNPFESYQDINYIHFFNRKSYQMFHFYDRLSKLEQPIRFKLSVKQGKMFTKYFQALLDKNKILLSQDLDANTKRLGVIAFRLAMILSSLRLLEREIGEKMPEVLHCSDQDYNVAMELATTLENHAIAVYQQMPKLAMKGARLSFFQRLPKSFNRKDYLALAKEIGMPVKTADKYITLFSKNLLVHDFNSYSKIENC